MHKRFDPIYNDARQRIQSLGTFGCDRGARESQDRREAFWGVPWRKLGTGVGGLVVEEGGEGVGMQRRIGSFNGVFHPFPLEHPGTLPASCRRRGPQRVLGLLGGHLLDRLDMTHKVKSWGSNLKLLRPLYVEICRERFLSGEMQWPACSFQSVPFFGGFGAYRYQGLGLTFDQALFFLSHHQFHA